MGKHEPFAAICTLPAGSDAEKGFYSFGVPEGKQLNICLASYVGGDATEVYQLVAVPVSATASLNDVNIEAPLGMVAFFAQMKGGALAPMATVPSLFGQTYQIVPGPCSVLIAASAANTAQFSCNVRGTISDLGDGM